MSSFTESLAQRYEQVGSAGETVDFLLNKRKLPSTAVERVPNVAELDDLLSSGSAGTPSSVRLGRATNQNQELARSLRSANFLATGAVLGTPGGESFSPSLLSRLKLGKSTASPLDFSPVFSSFPSIKPQALEKNTPEAQTIRRKLLRGSQVLIFQAGYSGKRFIFEHLKELGIKLTILDGPDSWAKCLIEEDIIESYIELDFTDYNTLFERAIDAILDSGITFDAVATFYEDAVAIVSRIAETLSLPGNPSSACQAARNKYVTREIMRQRGLPTPKCYHIVDAADLEPAGQHVGFPAILKPAFGAASMGVHKVCSRQELVDTFRAVQATMDVHADTIWSQGTDLLLEEFYDGDEFDVDALMSKGEVVYTSLSDNWACWEPWFQETGMNIPSLYPTEKQEELIRFASETLHALGFTDGAFHVEVKYTSRGPRLIEVNARMGGMCVRDANLRTWGVDLVEEHIMTALGIPIRPRKPAKPLVCFAQAAVNAPYTGVVESADWLEGLDKYPQCKLKRYLVSNGAKVIGPEDGMPDWVAEIIFEGPEVTELLRQMRDAVYSLPVPIRPLREPARRGWFFPDFAYPFRNPESSAKESDYVGPQT
jgi:carnosine synthase